MESIVLFGLLAVAHSLWLPATPVESLAAADLGPGGCPSATLRLCSGHGQCDMGHCRCDRGFAGPACEVRAYLFACPGNCSAASGGGKCIDGQCVCARGRSGDDCGAHTPVNCSVTCAANGHGECVDGECRCKPGYYGPDCLQGCPAWHAESGKVRPPPSHLDLRAPNMLDADLCGRIACACVLRTAVFRARAVRTDRHARPLA